jgi:hypothetical protein
MISYAGYRTGFPGKVYHRLDDGTEFALWDFSAPVDDFRGGYNYPPQRFVGPGTEYPARFTLDQVAELCWRVKKYHATHALTIAQGGHIFSGSGYGDSVPVGLDTPTPNEAGLIGPGYAFPNFAIDEFDAAFDSVAMRDEEFAGNEITWLEFGEGEPIEGFGWIGLSVFGARNLDREFTIHPGPFGYHALRFWDGSYWPNIICDAYYDAAYYGGRLSTRIELVSADPVEWNPLVAAKVDFFGVELDLYGGFAGDSATGTIEISAAEYWPYNGRWDPATGEPN